MNWKGLSLNWNLLRKSRPKLGCTCLQTPWKGLLDQHCCSLLEEASDFRTIVQNFCTFVQSALALVSMSITDQLLRLKIPSSGLLLWSCHYTGTVFYIVQTHCWVPSHHIRSCLLSNVDVHLIFHGFGRRSELANFTMLVSSKAVAASSINTWWEMTRLWNVRRTLPLLFSRKDRGGHLHCFSLYNTMASLPPTLLNTSTV